MINYLILINYIITMRETFVKNYLKTPFETLGNLLK